MSEYSFEEADKQIRGIATLEGGRNRRNMTLGWLGAKMKSEGAWTQNGYADEAAYRDAAGVSTGVWGRYVRIGLALEKLSLTEFARLSAENAELLGTLPVELRYDFAWVEKATNQHSEDFKRDVLKVKADVAGVAPADMRVKFSLPLFEAQRTVIKGGLKDFMREHQIKDEGTALEWLVLEYTGRKTFSSFLQRQIPIMRTMAKSEDALWTKDQLREFILEATDIWKNLKGEPK